MSTWILTFIKDPQSAFSRKTFSSSASDDPSTVTCRVLLGQVEALLARYQCVITKIAVLKPQAVYDIFFQTAPDLFRPPPSSALKFSHALANAMHAAQADYLIQADDPQLFPRKKTLLISDMDSTLIANETLNDLAALLGLKEDVTAITRLGMDGAISFLTSLQRRVKLLKGHPTQVLTQLLEEIRFHPDAHLLVSTMRHHHAHTILASGGFKPITTFVKEKLGFNEEIANTLAIKDHTFTGALLPPLSLDKTKYEALLSACTKRNLPRQATLAVGDGANDIPMIIYSGLGVLFHPTQALMARLPAVRPSLFPLDVNVNAASAPIAAPPAVEIHAFTPPSLPIIRYHSLRALLYFQGYTEENLAAPK